MKRIVVYFSLEGNTEYIADELAKVLPADKLKLVPKKAYSTSGFSKFFWGGKSAVLNLMMWTCQFMMRSFLDFLFGQERSRLRFGRLFWRIKRT